MALVRTAFEGTCGAIEARQRRVIDHQWPEGLPRNAATSYTPDAGPTTSGWTPGNKSHVLTFDVGYGLTLIGNVFHPLETPPEGGIVRNGWIIYCNGHEGSGAAYTRAEYFVDRGFRTICLFMPTFEPNETSWTYEGTGGGVTMDDAAHADFSIVESQGRNIIPMFLDQVFRAANWIRLQDGPDAIIHLTGHSGGGWMTSACAALDKYKYFKVKYSCAGELPFYFNESVHIEQHRDRPYWFGMDWTHWYAMAARYGKFVKVHNENDDCCYVGAGRHERFASLVNQINGRIAGYPGEFDIVVDDENVHTYSDEMKQLFIDDCIEFEP